MEPVLQSVGVEFEDWRGDKCTEIRMCARCAHCERMRRFGILSACMVRKERYESENDIGESGCRGGGVACGGRQLHCG